MDGPDEQVGDEADDEDCGHRHQRRRVERGALDPLRGTGVGEAVDEEPHQPR